MENSNNDNRFWSLSSLKAKIGIWSQHQIDLFRNLLNLQANEFIIDVGSGFSPLGHAFLPYILPKGHILGIDIDKDTVQSANDLSKEQGKFKLLSFKQGNVMHLLDNFHTPADLIMCQQLLVNLTDPVTALEEMINLLKTSGRIFCIENINYGAFCARPDFSWRSNLKMSQIWQKLCITGKWGQDYASTAFGANLPQVFQQLDLKNIQWQIISPGTHPQPPYFNDFKQQFMKQFHTERKRLAHLYENSWAPNTDISQDDLDFFIENMVVSNYDVLAVQEDRPITLWYYPFLVISGWVSGKTNNIIQGQIENLNISIDI